MVCVKFVLLKIANNAKINTLFKNESLPINYLSKAIGINNENKTDRI